VEVLAGKFLEDLSLSQPPVPQWRQVQARQALEVFARGIEHWCSVPRCFREIFPLDFRRNEGVVAGWRAELFANGTREVSSVRRREFFPGLAGKFHRRVCLI
jgi:hypothetical protein